MEHKTCEGCQWNEYPLCKGTELGWGFMNIEKMKEGFLCGQKDLDTITDFSIQPKSELDLLKEELDLLKERIIELEK